MSMTLADKKKSFLPVFEALGFLVLDATESGHVKGPCPFCEHVSKETGKKDYFHLNKETGQWDCKACSRSGNLWTLLTQLSQEWFDRTTHEQFKELAAKRGLPTESLKRLRWCFGMGQWCLPVWNEAGTFVHNLYQWDERKNIVLSLPFPCEQQLVGQDELAKAPKGALVWVCEGPWDACAMRYMLDKSGHAADCVVAVPGANTFKKWDHLFLGKKVRLMYDNDVAGDEGSMKVGERLHKQVPELKYLSWPEALKTGYDVRDFFKVSYASKTPMPQALAKLEGYLTTQHRRAKEFAPVLKTVPANVSVTLQKKPPPNYPTVLKHFGKWLRMNEDFKTALAVALATCLANDVPGDPLWLYIVGPASSGKSVILTAIKDSPRVSFHSSVTAKTLVSGWNQNGADPSLLPRLDGKTAVFKDGTELLEMRSEQRREVYATLRGAYDGYVHREYAQGAQRDWKSHFNMLIGVTNAIHGEQRAAMGERFLKLEMIQDVETIDAMVDSAIRGESHEPKMEEELGAICVAFLERTVDLEKLPKIPEEFIIKIAAMAKLVAVLRAQVEREQYGAMDMRYRPVKENPTRIAKQLAKLSRMLCLVYDKTVVDRDIYSILRKVGTNSCATFHFDLAMTLLRTDRPMSIRELAEKLKLPSTFLVNKLADMEQLDIVVKTMVKDAGHLVGKYRIVQEIYDLWQKSKVFTK